MQFNTYFCKAGYNLYRLQMKQLLWIFLFLPPFQIQGQQISQQYTIIDSLKNIIATAQHDTIKINAYNAWDNIIYLSDPQLDQELNHKIVEIAIHNLNKKTLSTTEKIVFQKSLALALNSLGIISYNKGDNSLARDYYSKSLKIRTDINDLKGIAATLNNIGIVYQDQAENAKAIDYYTRSLRINEEIGDKNGEANCLSNIGRIYYGQKELDKALYYQMRSLKIREKTGDKIGMAIAYNNIGSIYLDQKNSEKAIEYFNRYLKIGEEIGDKNKIALALDNIGTVYEAQQNLIKALEYYNRSLELFKSTENKKWESALLVKIGSIYAKKGGNAKAIELYINAITIAQAVRQVAITKDASRALYTSYKTSGKYKEALTMHELYIQMRDSILSESNQKEILQQEFKYAYEKQKALDTKEKEKQLAITLEKEQKQNVILSIVTFSFLTVSALSFSLFNRFKLINKQKKIIEQQNLHILESINYSKKIQDSLLPSLKTMQNSIQNLYIYYKPKAIVSGDFYFFKELENHVLFVCADCTGHGVPGGFMCTLGNLLLDKITNDIALSPSKILNCLNNEIIRILHQHDGGEIQDGIDLSICLIDLKSHTVDFSGARNGITIVTDGKAKRYKADPLPVGGCYIKNGVPLERNFRTQTIPISSKDWIYMYTDGYIEQSGGRDGGPMNYAEFENVLITLSGKNTEDEKKIFLQNHLYNWKKSNQQDDDILIIGLQI